MDKVDIDTVLEEAVSRLDTDIALHDKVRSYVVIREICFWKAIAEEANRKVRDLLELLPEELRAWIEK